MKTFLRKMKLSLLAMLCGWVACNIALWVGMLPNMVHHPVGRQFCSVMFLYAFYTGIVILAAWLVVFFPVDLLISDHSKLRRPRHAAVCGFVAGSSVVVILLGWELWKGTAGKFSPEFLTWNALVWLSSPGITGMVAAYVRSRNREPSLTRP